MDKGFKKEKLIKRLNGVTSDNVSRKKKQNTYMAQSRQKWPNLISQRIIVHSTSMTSKDSSVA